LYRTRRWEEAFARGASLEDLRAALLAQLGVANALVSKPGVWDTKLAQTLVDLLLLWAAGRGEELGQELFDLLFRVSLSLAGAAPTDIEKAVAKLRGEKLPKEFRKALAAANLPSDGRRKAKTGHSSTGQQQKGGQQQKQGEKKDAKK
jgi:hypothetical protein